MDSAASSANLPAPRRSRKVIWFAVGLGVALLVVGWLMLSLDEPRPDTRDLARPARTVNDEENAFVHLVRTAAAVDATAWASEGDLFFAVARGQKWDAPRAAAWLAANDHLWPMIDRAVSLPISQGPIPTSVAGAVFKEVGPLRELANLVSVRAWHLHHSGQTDAAFAWLAKWLQAAHRVEDSNSILIVSLTGQSLHTSGRSGIEALLNRAAPSAETARRLIQTLDSTRPTGKSLGDAFAHEHAFNQLALDHVGANPGASTHDPTADRMLATSHYVSFLYKPNQTARLSAEHFREAIAQVDWDWPALRAAKSSVPPNSDPWEKWNPSNAAGRLLVPMLTPALHVLLVKRLRTQSAISALQAMIAVRVFENEHGTLPPNLSVLVPGILAQIPQDYFDGAPIRYSPEVRALWSVGENHLTVTSRDETPPAREVFLRLPHKAP